MPDVSNHSAKESLIGYTYQCRFALLESLKRWRDNPSFEVAIETLDDVVFEKEGRPTDIFQTKHHISKKANLTNSSVELWKTIGIWCELHSGDYSAEDSNLFLITTGKAKKGSAAYLLRPENRDVKEACSLLLDITNRSDSELNNKFYKQFKNLNENKRIEILEKVVILDNSPSICELREQIIRQIRGCCDQKFLTNMAEALEGWWMNRIVDAIINEGLNCHSDIEKNTNNKIFGQEIENKISDLREQFKQDSLPNYDDISENDINYKDYNKYMFANQIRIIRINDNEIRHATKDFYITSTQRSRWVKDYLIFDKELDKFDNKLIQEWERQSIDEKDDLPSDPSENDLIDAGRRLYRWARRANYAIRPNYSDLTFTRGTYQILADQLKVGWHPNYLELLKTPTED